MAMLQAGVIEEMLQRQAEKKALRSCVVDQCNDISLVA